jgi:hypothetical protein
MDNRTVELVKTAEQRQYTKFEEVAKEILKDKVKQSQAFQEFKEKMETIYEACGKKLGEEDKDKDRDAEIDADDEDNDGKKDSEEDHGDLPKDFKGDHKKAEKEKEED